MTAAEISTMRKELEDALLKAFTDFQAKTGLCIVCAGVNTVEILAFGVPSQKLVTSVHIALESL